MTRRERKQERSGEAKKEGRKGAEEKSAGRGLIEWIKSLAIAVALLIVLKTFVLQTFVITSGSMENTLLVGDFLMVNRLAIGSRVPFTSIRIPGYSEPHRGDVLVFDPHHEVDLKLVKRLVGLPGDTLEMRDKTLYLNGAAQEEPYARHVDDGGDDSDRIMNWQRAHLTDAVDAAAYRPSRDNWGPLVVPGGHYFMLGDNRDESYDSRYWGPLETWRIEGRVSFLYFSFNKGSRRAFPWVREVRWGRIGDRIR